MKYKIRYIDSVRFIASTLSSLTYKLAESLIKDNSSLEHMKSKDGLLMFKSVHCKKSYEKKFDEDLSSRFENIYQFCDRDINKFTHVAKSYLS